MEAALRAVAAGDLEALQHLYHELRPAVYAAAFAILQDPAAAEDVLQDTFLRVHVAAPKYQPGTRPRAWIVSIARHIALDILRKRKREVGLEIAPSPTIPGSESMVAERMDLLSTLACLEPVDRQIVVLHVVAGLTHREIAVELRLRPGTVRWRFRQALQELARRMGEVYHV